MYLLVANSAEPPESVHLVAESKMLSELQPSLVQRGGTMEGQSATVPENADASLPTLWKEAVGLQVIHSE